MKLNEKGLSKTVYGMMGLFLISSFSVGGIQNRTAFQSLSVSQILEKAVARANQENELELLKQYRFKLLRVQDKLDGDGELKERDEEVYENILIEGFPYQKLIEKNGQDLTEREGREEEKREAEFREKIAEGKDPNRDEESEFSFNRDLVGRFDFSLEGLEEVEDRSSYLLSYRPKKGKLPVNRRIDRALNKAEGRVWIDQESYEVSRVEFELKEKVKLWWGLIGSIQELRGSVQRREVDSGVWFPTGFDLYLKGRIFFRSLHSRQKLRWIEFDRVNSSEVQVVD